MNHYDTLGVTPLSSTKTIKRAYRKSALLSHPDKVSPELREEATKKFQDIQVAYDTLQDPDRRKEYDSEIGRHERAENLYTPPGSVYEGYDYGFQRQWEMPPTPESPSGNGWDEGFRRGGMFDAKKEFRESVKKPKFMTFADASILFRPEDRRHIWLCSPEDDPAESGGHLVSKYLYVSLQEIFLKENIELTIFRYTYMEDGMKVVEMVRVPIKLKPHLSEVAATIDLFETGNEDPTMSSPQSSRKYRQHILIVPVDEAELYGEGYDGQFFSRANSKSDVEVHHTQFRDDLTIRKRLWSFEIDIPTLSGMSMVTQFKGRLRRGQFTAILKGQGMWRYQEGGDRGDLYVRLTIK